MTRLLEQERERDQERGRDQEKERDQERERDQRVTNRHKVDLALVIRLRENDNWVASCFVRADQFGRQVREQLGRLFLAVPRQEADLANTRGRLELVSPFGVAGHCDD